VYSSIIDGRPLNFHAINPFVISDLQTGSLWNFRTGICIAGDFEGKHLTESKYTVEDIFPYRGASAASLPLIAIWQRFEANWYLRISNTGYSINGSTAFFPLYPFLMRLFGKILGDDFWAGLLLSNVALIGALYFLHQTVAEFFDAQSACRTVLYLLVFPSSFFLLTAYTESLFLFFSLASFYYAHRSRWGIATIFGVLSALTRLQGVLIFIALFYLWWKQGVRRSPITLVWISGIPLASLSFLFFTNMSMLTSLETVWQASWVLPWENMNLFLQMFAQSKIGPIDWFNLLTVILIEVSCIFVWKILPREFAVYAVLLRILPLFRLNNL